MTPMPSVRRWSIRLAIGIGLLLVVFVFGVLGPLVLLRGTLRRDEYLDRFLICFAFFIWGLAYYAAKARTNKLLFAFLQIVVALGTEWYQTGKFAEEMTKTQAFDRWVFIIVGVLVIGNGLEKIYTESEKYIPPNPVALPALTPHSATTRKS
jgi:hypothetical protein